jgi:hypothetical protein
MPDVGRVVTRTAAARKERERVADRSQVRRDAEGVAGRVEGLLRADAVVDAGEALPDVLLHGVHAAPQLPRRPEVVDEPQVVPQGHVRDQCHVAHMFLRPGPPI